MRTEKESLQESYMNVWHKISNNILFSNGFNVRINRINNEMLQRMQRKSVIWSKRYLGVHVLSFFNVFSVCFIMF